MSTHKNKYRLSQDDKEYILTTLIIGQTLKISCQDNKDKKAKVFEKYYTLENLHAYDALRSTPSLIDAFDTLDKLIGSKKIGIEESNNKLNVIIYFSQDTNIIFYLDPKNVNVVNPPLKSPRKEYSEQQYSQEEYPPEMYQQDMLQPKTIIRPTQLLKTTINVPIIRDHFYNVEYNQYPQNNYADVNDNIYSDTNSLQPTFQQNYIDNPYDLQNYEKYENYGAENNVSNINYEQIQQNNNINYEQAGQTPYDYNQYLYEQAEQTPYDYNQYLYEQAEQPQNIIENNYQYQPKIIKNKAASHSVKPTISNAYKQQSNLYDLNQEYLSEQNQTQQISNVNVTEQQLNQTLNQKQPQQQLQQPSKPKSQNNSLEQQLLKENEMLKSQLQKSLTQNKYYETLMQSFKSEKEKLILEKNNNINTELNGLKTENESLKLQLLEIPTLRRKVAELEVLRGQLGELNALRAKLAEMNTLKGQLGELNTLRAKLAEMNTLKGQLGELNALKAKLAEMNTLKGQLGELNALKAKLAEMNTLKSQLGELERLRSVEAENNLLRSQLAELNVLRAQAAEAGILKKKITALENIRAQYEQEVAKLKLKHVNTSEQQVNLETAAGDENKEYNYEKNIDQIAVKGDIIHNTAEIEMLTKKINKRNKKLTLNLLYKATVDSDKASAFHEKCDSAQSSLILIETTKGVRFGGYTTCSWKGDCIDKRDEDAFVFSLDKMKIYDNIPGEDAIGCYPKFGPIFLGCQIRIYDNAFVKGGTTFEKGLNFNTEEDFELNLGERVYGVKEVEVYDVIPQ